MKRPVLNVVPLNATMGQSSVNITMSEGQRDSLLQDAYDAGFNLIELNEYEIPFRAYRKECMGLNLEI